MWTAHEVGMAARILILLAVVCGLLGAALFFLHAFAYLIAIALAIVFGFGALVALAFQRPAGR